MGLLRLFQSGSWVKLCPAVLKSSSSDSHFLMFFAVKPVYTARGVSRSYFDFSNQKTVPPVGYKLWLLGASPPSATFPRAFILRIIRR